MNTSNDQLESMMTTELRDRADDVGATWLDVAAVRGRATSIRRRRRVGAGLGAAAALAIVVPLAMTAGGSLERERKVEPAAPTEVVRTTLTLDGLERGEAPRVEYFTPDGVVLPGSGLQPLDDSWQALVPNDAGGGWYGLSPSKDEVVDLTEDFDQDFSRTVTQAMVSSPDRSLVAWTVMETDGQVLSLRSTTDPTVGNTWDLSETPMVQPVDFVGERSLVFQTIGAQGPSSIAIAHEDGSTTPFERKFLGAVSASPETGLVAVQTQANADASACFGVVDPAKSTASPVWESCDYSLGAFSPDGRHVLASDAYQSGIGPVSLSVLDASTGELVASFEQQRDAMLTLRGVAWETTDTIVAVANDGNTYTILRLGLDGTLEETVDELSGDAFGDAPYYLGADRRRGF